MLRNRAVVALVAWTLLVWTTRIGNIWRDEALDTAGKVGRTALALSFTVLAVAVAVAVWRRAGTARRAAVVALACWTTAVWLVRSVAITTGDHDTGFKVVHLVLAVISITLAALAVRSPGRDLGTHPSMGRGDGVAASQGGRAGSGGGGSPRATGARIS